MSKLKIKQSTFDDAIRENVADLEMEPDEAVIEAVNQLKSQNVDLSGIVTQPKIIVDENGVYITHPVVQALHQFQILTSSPDPDEGALKSCLQTICNECNIDFAHRFLAVENKAFGILTDAWKKFVSSNTMLLGCVIDALIAVGNGQPDCFDADLIQLACNCLSANADNEHLCIKVLKLMQVSCLMHEKNRQSLIDGGVLGPVMAALLTHSGNGMVVRRACNLLRTLILDDDVRVEFGRAHDHAKQMVVEHSALKVLAQLLKEHKEDAGIASEILLTLGRLVVRHEYCKEVVDLGVLEEVYQLCLKNLDDQALVRNILGLLKAIAGNDEVKAVIIKAGGGGLVVSAMNRHACSSQITEMACGTIAMLSLRSPLHSAAIIEAGGAAAIIKAMELHGTDKKVLKQACLAIRNLVARSRQFCSDFLNLGAEELIRKARSACPQIQDETKAALRDLGLDVELQELWTGKKGNIVLD